MRGLRQNTQTDVAVAASKIITITVVNNAEELQIAIEQGAEHIEVRQHLDISKLSIDAAEGPALLGQVPESVKSLQVRTL